jgi:hypothetical protein
VSTTPYLRTALRRIVGCVRRGAPLPVEVIDDEGSPIAPHLTGESAYYTTPSGKTIVLSPRSYGYRTVYHVSTRRVVVGETWLANALRSGIVAR